jgi:hypothetical protein
MVVMLDGWYLEVGSQKEKVAEEVAVEVRVEVRSLKVVNSS